MKLEKKVITAASWEQLVAFECNLAQDGWEQASDYKLDESNRPACWKMVLVKRDRTQFPTINLMPVSKAESDAVEAEIQETIEGVK